MNTKTSELIFRLQDSLKGDPWYGDSVLSKLREIDYKTADISPLPNINSIAKILQHLINWHLFTVRKIKGDKTFVIEQNDHNDWTPVSIKTEGDWQDLIGDFRNSAKELIRELEGMDDSFLKEVIPGKPYTFGYLLNGLVQHNIYHLGQIALLKKWIDTINGSENVK
jgi:hypothetical protein